MKQLLQTVILVQGVSAMNQRRDTHVLLTYMRTRTSSWNQLGSFLDRAQNLLILSTIKDPSILTLRGDSV